MSKLLKFPPVRDLLTAETDELPVEVQWETPDGQKRSISVFIEDHDQPRSQLYRFTGHTEFGVTFTLDVWDGVEAGLVIHEDDQAPSDP